MEGKGNYEFIHSCLDGIVKLNEQHNQEKKLLQDQIDNLRSRLLKIHEEILSSTTSGISGSNLIKSVVISEIFDFSDLIELDKEDEKNKKIDKDKLNDLVLDVDDIATDTIMTKTEIKIKRRGDNSEEVTYILLDDDYFTSNFRPESIFTRTTYDLTKWKKIIADLPDKNIKRLILLNCRDYSHYYIDMLKKQGIHLNITDDSNYVYEDYFHCGNTYYNKTIPVMNSVRGKRVGIRRLFFDYSNEHQIDGRIFVSIYSL